MTVKFKEATAAQACILKMNGRFFDGRKVCPPRSMRCLELTIDLRWIIYWKREIQEEQQRHRSRRSRKGREGEIGQFRSVVGR